MAEKQPPTEAQIRGQNAQMLLANPEFSRAFETVEQGIIDGLRMCGVTDEDRSGRDALILQLQLLTLVKDSVLEVADELTYNPVQ